MGLNKEGSVHDAKLALTSDLELHHAELITRCGSRSVHIVVQFFHIEHDEASQAITGAQSLEHILPVVLRVNFVSAHSMHVDDVNGSRHFVDQDERTNAAELLLKFNVKNNKIVLADRCKLQNVGVLVLRLASLLIVRDELAGGLVPSYKSCHDEANDAIGIALTFVLEVEALSALSNGDGFIMGTVSQNELLQVQEGAFMMNALPHLDLCLPCMRRVRLLTVITLLVLDGKFDLESLLEERVRLNLLLHRKLDFNPL